MKVRLSGQIAVMAPHNTQTVTQVGYSPIDLYRGLEESNNAIAEQSGVS